MYLPCNYVMEQPVLTVCNYVDVIGSYGYTYVTNNEQSVTQLLVHIISIHFI